MTAVDYDFEFLEDGSTIRPISVGMVCDDGREYYAVFDDVDTIDGAVRHDWLRANVIPSLPIVSPPVTRYTNIPFAHFLHWNNEHADFPCIKHRDLIANEIRAFLQATPDLELWAWYGAYDHVALAQLFGTMVDLPGGIPMWTNDTRQECARLGMEPGDLPQQPGGLHHALTDARHNRVRREFLARHAAARGRT